MTIQNVDTSTCERIQTTICGLCGAVKGEDYCRFSTHLSNEHTFDDLYLDGRVRRSGENHELMADGGSVQDEADETGGRSVDDTEQPVGLETTECWRCGEDRYIYESCPHCGGSCKPLTKRKQQKKMDVDR